MPLLDTSYFTIEERLIPNLNEGDVDGILSDFMYTVKQCEMDVLIKALGIMMYRDFSQYVDGNGVNLNMPQHYKDIVYGKVYEVEHKGTAYTKYWEGLLNKERCYSLLADYVYYQYWQTHVTRTTSYGEGKNMAEVSMSVDMTPKLSRVWNRFLRYYEGGCCKNYYQNENTYPFRFIQNRLRNGVGLDYYQGNHCSNSEVSLLRFLHDNKADYPLLEESPYTFGNHLKMKTSWGI